MMLLNMWFVSRNENGQDKWQGEFIKTVSPTLYMVQLYSWVDGTPTCYKLVDIEDIAFQEWELYKTYEDFKNRG